MSCLVLMETIRRSNSTQSLLGSGCIKLIVRLSSLPTPLEMTRPNVFNLFYKKENCGGKNFGEKNRARYTKKSKHLMAAWYVDNNLIPVMFVIIWMQMPSCINCLKNRNWLCTHISINNLENEELLLLIKNGRLNR